MVTLRLSSPSFFLFLLLTPFHLSHSEDSPSIPSSLLDRHEALLNRLEALVSTLEQSVANSDKLKQQKQQSEMTAASFDKPAVSVAKHKPMFNERFVFSSAAKLSSSVPTSATPLPFEDHDGLSKYFAIGDSVGSVYVFSCSGDVILSLPSFSNSSVTSMLSYNSRKHGECLLFVGHSDGSVGVHRLSESASSPESDWLSLSTVGPHRLITRGLDNSPVTILEFYPIARTRYIITGDEAGRIRVFTENGTLYGTAIASSRPIAFMKQRLLFLTETGAASLELRSMAVRETECEGLNGSVARAYSFDPSERSKAYGFTQEGDLVHLVILGDVSNLKCRVRAVRRSEFDKPASIQTIKGGYLLVATQDKIFVYNISSQYYGRVSAPRPLFFTEIQEIKSQFLNPDSEDSETGIWNPIISAGRVNLVILGFGDNYIGVYRAKFPITKPENSAVVWSGPALLFLLFLIGIWQFYVKKKDSLGWIPDESFNSSGVQPAGSLLSTERVGLTDSSRSSGRMGPTDQRRDPRRYLSPTRYSGVSTGLNYRAVGSETGLGYSTGFGKKRDLVFQSGSSSQLGDEHVD